MEFQGNGTRGARGDFAQIAGVALAALVERGAVLVITGVDLVEARELAELRGEAASGVRSRSA